MLNNVEGVTKAMSTTKWKHAGKVLTKMSDRNVTLKIEYNAASQLMGMINGQKKIIYRYGKNSILISMTLSEAA